MPWKICNQIESRAYFISDHSRGQLSFSELCRRHGISRKTGYKWIKRYKESGLSGLCDRSRKPRVSPSRSSDAIEQEVLAVRKEHPVWDGRKIRRIMLNEGIEGAIPAPSTISNILCRQGLLGSGTREGSKP